MSAAGPGTRPIPGPNQSSNTRPDTTPSRTRRTTRACDNCRRLKEKCNGGTPCDRCNKSNRQCVFTDAYRRTRNPHLRASNPKPVTEQVDPTTFFEVDRIRALEKIVHHCTGVDRFTKSSLQELLASLRAEKDSPHEPIADDIDVDNVGSAENSTPRTDSSSRLAAYEEFSHLHFSRRVEQKMESFADNHQHDSGPGIVPAEQLLSRDSLVQDAASLFPPPEVALLLLDVFFNVAQTNYFYVDEVSLRDHLGEFYAPTRPLTIADAPWLCTALMVFTVGTQFAHLAPNTGSLGKRVSGGALNLSSVMDDTLALAFYRKAITLMPDILAIGSSESVQAFGLMGIYALPLDPSGLSCTYFGIAVKIATHNGMHKSNSESSSVLEQEIRNRLWWTIYTLDRRISILHGRPPSISRSEVDADLPVDIPEMHPSERVDTFPNVMAQRGITDIMEDARDAILALKKADKLQIRSRIQDILKVKQRLRDWWGCLPEETCCRDLTPGKPLFRSNIHLALTYHLVQIFIGRSFIFSEIEDETVETGEDVWKAAREDLIQDCIGSAVVSIDLCVMLRDGFGLSKSSYTEFTSCCAAVLALVARRIFTNDSALKELCDQGLSMLKDMSVGVFAKSCEKRGLDILQVALQKLDGNQQENMSLAAAGYAEFRNWVAMQQIVPGELPQHEQTMPLRSWGSGTGSVQGMTHPPRPNNAQEFVPSTFADLGSLPGLDEWLQHSMG